MKKTTNNNITKAINDAIDDTEQCSVCSHTRLHHKNGKGKCLHNNPNPQSIYPKLCYCHRFRKPLNIKPEKQPSRKSCLNCANWRENPEQCYDCSVDKPNRWRPTGSPGFTRDAGKPTNPQVPLPPNVISLLREVLNSHYYKDDPNYNECDKDPCQWCLQVHQLGIFPSPK